MKITIGHLYNDLMNLYGEIGNIKVLKYQLKKQGIDVLVKNLSINDDIDFDELDMIYIGQGTEENRLLVLEDLIKYKDKIKDAINDGKFFLITGNALALFGKYIKLNEKEIKALNVFNFYTEQSEKRFVNEVVTNTKLIKEDIYGFMNHSDITIENNNYLFTNEGVMYNNFYGTNIIGPLLARNPLFLKYFIKKFIINKNKKFKFKPFDLKLEEMAYKEFIQFKKTKKHIK